MRRWVPVAALLLGFALLGFVRPHADTSGLRATSPVTITRVERIDTKLNPSPTGRATLLANDKPFFPIGVTYHFTRHRSQWDKDLRLMREMGLNTVRADLAWRDIVPYFEGNYQFDVLDEFLDKAAENGLYVIPVFSYATIDYNTPWWFWARYRDWGMVAADGLGPWGDFPSVNHPEYRRLFTDYIRQTVRHIRDHPAILAYQILNEPHYPKRSLSDYNEHAIDAFRTWVDRHYRSVDILNASWLTSYNSTAEIAPPTGPPTNNANIDPPGSAQQWRDWRAFTYDNLTSFVDDLVEVTREEDQDRHAVLVSEMTWWWWGEQPVTGVSPAHIYRAADVVGFDVYPEGGQHANYYSLNADLLTRLWQRPVWVTELNRKDGNPTSAEIKGFTAHAVEGGATGIFYFQWRDAWSDGGAYGLLDSRGNPKRQFAGFATTVEWLTQNAERLLSAALAPPDAHIVWPTERVATAWGASSPAHDVYKAALRLTHLGLRVGLVPEEHAAYLAPVPEQESVIYPWGFRAE